VPWEIYFGWNSKSEVVKKSATKKKTDAAAPPAQHDLNLGRGYPVHRRTGRMFGMKFYQIQPGRIMDKRNDMARKFSAFDALAGFLQFHVTVNWPGDRLFAASV
jgi:hypothetical protein